MNRLALPLALLFCLPASLLAIHPDTRPDIAPARAERFALEFLNPDEAIRALRHIIPQTSIHLQKNGHVLLVDE